VRARPCLSAPLQHPAARACAYLRLPAPPAPAGAACALRSACEWQARATRGADACFCCACAGGATTAAALRGDAPPPALRWRLQSVRVAPAGCCLGAGRARRARQGVAAFCLQFDRPGGAGMLLRRPRCGAWDVVTV
jgi:hypothetical protein